MAGFTIWGNKLPALSRKAIVVVLGFRQSRFALQILAGAAGFSLQSGLTGPAGAIDAELATG